MDLKFPFRLSDGRMGYTRIPQWVYRVINGEKSDHDIIELAEVRFLTGISWVEGEY